MEPLPVPSAGLELRKPERVALHTVFQADREYRGASRVLHQLWVKHVTGSVDWCRQGLLLSAQAGTAGSPLDVPPGCRGGWGLPSCRSKRMSILRIKLRSSWASGPSSFQVCDSQREPRWHTVGSGRGRALP